MRQLPILGCACLLLAIASCDSGSSGGGGSPTSADTATSERNGTLTAWEHTYPMYFGSIQTDTSVSLSMENRQSAKMETSYWHGTVVLKPGLGAATLAANNVMQYYNAPTGDTSCVYKQKSGTFTMTSWNTKPQGKFVMVTFSGNGTITLTATEAYYKCPDVTIALTVQNVTGMK